MDSSPSRGLTTPGDASWLPLLAVSLGYFMVILDATAVNLALPALRQDLGGGITGLQWVVDGYTLLFAALLLSAGALSDRVGARRAFGAGIGLFALASAGCGLAPTIGALIAARVVQGAAAAVIMPSSMALIGQATPIRSGGPAPWPCGRWAARSPPPAVPSSAAR